MRNVKKIVLVTLFCCFAGLLLHANSLYNKEIGKYSMMDIKELEEFVKTDPDSPVPYVALGDKYMYNKEYKKAEKAYLKAKKKNVNFRFAYEGLGRIYIEWKQYDEAIKCFEKAIERKLFHFNAYRFLAEIYAVHSGDRDKAIEILQTFENNLLTLGKKDKRSAKFYFTELSKIYIDIGEYSYVDSCLNSYSRNYLNIESPAFDFIDVYKSFDIVKAETIIEQHLNSHPDNMEIAAKAMNFYSRDMSNKEKARSIFDKQLKALEAKPLIKQDLQDYKNLCHAASKAEVAYNTKEVQKTVLRVSQKIINENIFITYNGEVRKNYERDILNKEIEYTSHNAPFIHFDRIPFNFDIPNELTLSMLFLLYSSSNNESDIDFYRNEILKFKPGTQYNLVNYAEMFYYIQDYKNSEKYYKSAISMMENKAKGYFNAGRVFYFAGEPLIALRMFQKALEINPNNFKVVELTAKAYIETDKYKEANRFFDHVLEPFYNYDNALKRINTVTYDFPEKYVTVHSDYYSSVQVKGARTYPTKKVVCSIYLIYLEYLVEKQENYSKTNDVLKNLKDIEKILPVNFVFSFYNGISGIYKQLNLDFEAELYKDKASAPHQSYDETMKKCLKYELNKEYKKALDCYIERLSQYPADRFIENHIIKNIMALKINDERNKDIPHFCKKALKLSSNKQFKYRLNKTLISYYNNKKDYDNAEKHYRKMLELSPFEVKAKIDLAKFLYRQKDHSECKSIMSELAYSLDIDEFSYKEINTAMTVSDFLMTLELYDEVKHLMEKLACHDSSIREMDNFNGYKVLKKDTGFTYRVHYATALLLTEQEDKAGTIAEEAYNLLPEIDPNGHHIKNMRLLSDLFVEMKDSIKVEAINKRIGEFKRMKSTEYKVIDNGYRDKSSYDKRSETIEKSNSNKEDRIFKEFYKLMEQNQFMKAMDYLLGKFEESPGNREIEKKLIEYIDRKLLNKKIGRKLINILERMTEASSDMQAKMQYQQKILDYHMKYSDISESEKCFSKMLEISLNSRHTKYRLALFYYNRHFYRKAKEVFSELAESLTENEMKIKDALFAVNISDYFIMLEMYKEAEQVLFISYDYIKMQIENNKFDRNDEQNSIVFYRLISNYCIALYETGKREEAVRLSNEAFKYFEANTTSKRVLRRVDRLGKLFEDLGEYDKAEKCYLALLSSKKIDKKAYKMLAALYRDKLDNEEKAIEIEEKFKVELRKFKTRHRKEENK